jgi:hypothetical protein
MTTSNEYTLDNLETITGYAWDIYMRQTDPTQKEVAARAYIYWADLRDAAREHSSMKERA